MKPAGTLLPWTRDDPEVEMRPTYQARFMDIIHVELTQLNAESWMCRATEIGFPCQVVAPTAVEAERATLLSLRHLFAMGVSSIDRIGIDGDSEKSLLPCGEASPREEAFRVLADEASAAREVMRGIAKWWTAARPLMAGLPENAVDALNRIHVEDIARPIQRHIAAIDETDRVTAVFFGAQK